MKRFAYILIAAGIAICCLSRLIVFPGLERLIGIEAIVGKHHVHYLEGGGYVYTNPTAIVLWIGAVAVIGLLVTVSGFVMLRRCVRSG